MKICYGGDNIIDYSAIGKRIKIVRIKQNLTQEALATKVKLSTTHISNIETGNTKLSLPTLTSIANALCVSVDELLCDNVLYADKVYHNIAQDLLADCDENEIRIIVDIISATKVALRKHKVFVNYLFDTDKE